jgi:hypothetical protein
MPAWRRILLALNWLTRSGALGFVSGSTGNRAECESVSSASQRTCDRTGAPW